jgi:predicted GNAT family acetyltransferase
MDVRLTDDIGEFAPLAQPFLRAEPFTTNVLAVEVDHVTSGRQPRRAGSVWILVEEAGQVVGAAMRTPPFNLFLPRLRDGVPEAIAGALADADLTFPGINGEVKTVRRFVRAWEALGGARSRVRVSTRMYALGTLRAPSGTRGYGRPATGADIDLIVRWLRAFRLDTRVVSDESHIADFAQSRLADHQYWLWEVDGEAVSLAGVHPPAAKVARVGPVYTPGIQRGHGYGSAVTALASRAGIDRGAEHVVLYTDLSNPTSNSIYQAIGYEPHHDAEEREFVDDGDD